MYVNPSFNNHITVRGDLKILILKARNISCNLVHFNSLFEGTETNVTRVTPQDILNSYTDRNISC